MFPGFKQIDLSKRNSQIETSKSIASTHVIVIRNIAADKSKIDCIQTAKSHAFFLYLIYPSIE